MIPKSEHMPDIDYSPPIIDLFNYFGMNWVTLLPATTLLFGILIGFALLKDFVNIGR